MNPIIECRTIHDTETVRAVSVFYERYGGDNAEKEAAKGSYLPARTRYRGLMRFSAFMSATDLSKTGEMGYVQNLQWDSDMCFSGINFR